MSAEKYFRSYFNYISYLRTFVNYKDINEKEFVLKMRKGIGALSAQMEVHACSLYCLRINSKSNEKGNDAKYFNKNIPFLSSMNVEIKNMGERIQLCESRMKGTRRGGIATKKNHIEWMNNLTHVIVVDMIDLPLICFIPVPIAKIRNFFYKDKRKKKPLSQILTKNFYGEVLGIEKDDIPFITKIPENMTEEDVKKCEEIVFCIGIKKVKSVNLKYKIRESITATTEIFHKIM